MRVQVPDNRGRPRWKIMPGFRYTPQHRDTWICGDTNPRQVRSDDQTAGFGSVPIPPARALIPHPPCFDSKEQWQQWHIADEVATHGRTQYCADCTPQYQIRMIDENRCVHPQVKFYKINGGLTGCTHPPADHDGVLCDEHQENNTDETINGETGS